jgi:hypothetical protein
MFHALLNPAIPMLLALDDEVVDQLCSLLRCVGPLRPGRHIAVSSDLGG